MVMHKSSHHTAEGKGNLFSQRKRKVLGKQPRQSHQEGRRLSQSEPGTAEAERKADKLLKSHSSGLENLGGVSHQGPWPKSFSPNLDKVIQGLQTYATMTHLSMASMAPNSRHRDCPIRLSPTEPWLHPAWRIQCAHVSKWNQAYFF